MTPVLLIPGLWNSGPDHWQSHWEQAYPETRRLQQRDWERPRCDEWVATLEAAVADSGPETVLAAHSLGCATVAHWAGRTSRRVRGALLVAPSDVEAPLYPAGTEGFAPMPLRPLPFPSIVVLSDDDEYVTLARGHRFAAAWGSEVVGIGAAGHVNSASRLALWPAGWRLVQRLAGAVPDIRGAVPADAPALAALSEVLGYPVTAAAMARRLVSLLEKPEHAVIVAESSDEGVVGWVHGTEQELLESERRCEILGLVVAAAHRQRGLGRRLVGALETWAVGRGLGQISVRSNVARAESHPFYQRLGYVRTKTSHVYRKPLVEGPSR